jgi:hypothetical protein
MAFDIAPRGQSGIVNPNNPNNPSPNNNMRLPWLKPCYQFVVRKDLWKHTHKRDWLCKIIRLEKDLQKIIDNHTQKRNTKDLCGSAFGLRPQAATEKSFIIKYGESGT